MTCAPCKGVQINLYVINRFILCAIFKLHLSSLLHLESLRVSWSVALTYCSYFQAEYLYLIFFRMPFPAWFTFTLCPPPPYTPPLSPHNPGSTLYGKESMGSASLLWQDDMVMHLQLVCLLSSQDECEVWAVRVADFSLRACLWTWVVCWLIYICM